MHKLLALLLFLPSLTFGQFPLADMSILPAAPTFVCDDCDPTDISNVKLLKLLDDAVILNFKSCNATGKNLFDQEATLNTCLRGAVFIQGAHNNIGYYIYSTVDNRVTSLLMFYSYRENDLTNCAQMVVCREQKSLNSS